MSADTLSLNLSLSLDEFDLNLAAGTYVLEMTTPENTRVVRKLVVE